jgi:putative tricarboxylic transport membrane protein
MRGENMNNRSNAVCFLALALLAALPAAAQTQAWKPEHNVELVIPTAAGSGSDRTGRLIQSLMQDKKLVEQSVTVVNKPGGGGAIGLNYVVQQTEPGLHFLVTSPTLLTNHILGKTAVTYRDLTPVAVIGADFVAFSVRADSPIKTGMDLVERLKKDTAGTTFALANALGNHNHIAIGELALAVGADIKSLKVVVFNSSGQVATSLLGGHVDVISSPASQVVEHARSGKLRIIAVASERRLSGALSSIPTWKEQGVSAVSANWRNVVGTKGMSDAQVAYWDRVFARLVEQPEWKQAAEKSLTENIYLDSAETRKQLDQLYKQLTVTLRGLGLAK